MLNNFKYIDYVYATAHELEVIIVTVSSSIDSMVYTSMGMSDYHVSVIYNIL